MDFQLGATNIRMRFTVRDKGEQPSPGCRSMFRELLADDPFLLFPTNPGIVYELFVNGKRFEDLTQALPSPVRIITSTISLRLDPSASYHLNPIPDTTQTDCGPRRRLRHDVRRAAHVAAPGPVATTPPPAPAAAAAAASRPIIAPGRGATPPAAAAAYGPGLVALVADAAGTWE